MHSFSKFPYLSKIPHPLILLAALAAFSNVRNVAAQCDNCPKRQVVLYDFNVTVPRPDSTGNLGAWYSLFFAGPGAGAALFNPDCLRFIDAAFYRDTTGVPSKSFSLGIDHPFTAPSGSMKGMDYLLTGTVSTDGSGYKLDMSLEAACSRKQVASASGHFDRPEQASTLGADLARSHFMPLPTLIRDFEKGERAADTKVSIGGWSSKLVVEPGKHKAAFGETVPVTLTLTDCDGEPLAGRKISLTGNGDKRAKPSTNGAFTMAEAVTGSNGSVTVDFKVGSVKGTAQARAYFIHQTPFGCEAIAMDAAAIAVEATAPFYGIKYTYIETRTMDGGTEERPLPGWLKTSRKAQSMSLVLVGRAILQNSSNAAGAGRIELDGAPLEGGSATGAYVESIHSVANSDYVDQNATEREGNYEDRITTGGPSDPDALPSAYFASCDPAHLDSSSQFSFTVPYNLQGTVTGHGFQMIAGSGYVSDSTTSVSTSDSSTTNISTSLAMTFKYQDSVVHVTAFKDTSWSADGYDSRWVRSLDATLAPITLAVKPNGIEGPKAQAMIPGNRLSWLPDGSQFVCRLSDVSADAPVFVGLYSLTGTLMSVLHDGARGVFPELSLKLPGREGPGVFLVLLKAGKIRQSQLVYVNAAAM